MSTVPLVVIIGPTASGKSALAVALARLLLQEGRPAQIVNADSMALYRGMDIGTAKPSPAERGGIPHHLIDVLDVRETSTVAAFQAMARTLIAELRDQGILPILVGGSSLYARAVVDDFEFPGTDPRVRARWEAELERLGAAGLHEVLAATAPEAARAILPGNGRRIVRALEVIELTGHYNPHLPEPRYLLENVHQYGLELDRDLMDERIAARVHAMFDQGLVEETRLLADAGLREGATASRALGYRQVLDLLDGRIDDEQAIESTIDGTRRFARKQLAWFRRDPRITWLPATEPGLAQRIAAELRHTDRG
ncbi:tRNA (adenosine(37)-N6)-dimethylallyltransferase MiaA [Propionibacterium australiense]|uniref:tRNA dimethylallyltransferase n=1 Tax=Propionibacterium australiense TaxID=119981 RepID=A0A383S4J4_9ACTN|nr:tRNA (adenosine(37)-N6)-dimethylallyltransferase MiaA [Propionibacterium australiense]RLP10634.1 tRNA (adenosine(37)-N6)-dimethylallyltransferase MiaA [Propionibacterium australiense]RLP12929.1 tRNA (adenosine(37)-N6)-dimethylallyltransferase MiaA [Propionibacterium australiense]SYZ32837.1 tRNA dimethylallyltransferase [Propionibacterium australiense]VEH91145.1 tRNA dimethylallyltransferase [Propionibacterium australiense]